MKKLIKLLSVLVLTTTTSSSIIACGGNPVAKSDLSSVTVLTGLNLNFNSGSAFSALNSQFKTATEFVNSPLNDYRVEWFDAATGGNDISDKSQIAGQVWVKISASSTDNNWTGSTGRIQLAINKNDLAKITALTGLSLSVDNTKKFSVLNSMLSTATEFKGNYFSKYTVKWFDAKIGGHDISNQLQSVRQVCVEITADSVDKNWQGTTPRLNININAANFNVIAGTTGAIVAMTTDSSNNTIYAVGKTASDVGKVYKSNGTDVFVAMDGIDEPIIKMATNNSNGKVYAISKTKVYVSTDGTAVFTEIPGISETKTIIAVSDDGTVYVGTNKGVYKSDGTNNFTIIPNNTDYISNVAVFQNTLYFSTRTTVYKLTGPDKFTEIPGITEVVLIDKLTLLLLQYM